MSPEIVLGKGHDKAADWWSVGILLFEMLTGKPPFIGGNREKIQQKIIKDKIKLPAFLSSEAHSILKGLLQREASRRLGSGLNGSEEIKRHKWFKPINWKKLEAREIQPSFRPNVAGKHCIANFEERWTNMPLLDSPVASPTAGGCNFVGFTYSLDIMFVFVPKLQQWMQSHWHAVFDEHVFPYADPSSLFSTSQGHNAVTTYEEFDQWQNPENNDSPSIQGEQTNTMDKLTALTQSHHGTCPCLVDPPLSSVRDVVQAAHASCQPSISPTRTTLPPARQLQDGDTMLQGVTSQLENVDPMAASHSTSNPQPTCHVPAVVDITPPVSISTTALSNDATLGTVVPPHSQQDTTMPHMSHEDTTMPYVFHENNVLGTATTSMRSPPGLPHSHGNSEPQPPVQLGHTKTTRSQDGTLKPNSKYLSSDYTCFADATPPAPKTIKSAQQHSALPVPTKDFAEPISSALIWKRFAVWDLRLKFHLLPMLLICCNSRSGIEFSSGKSSCRNLFACSQIL
ncbi:hypothetical protein MRB53_026294 [Persea americana]|uniref:Uncharacterized protein n=1 Tax=Persea americana TaxID=3435 RepID=A0ACC2LIF6_PERAE|nr:hypothetical protein MRB53_026294 [Persea americana]